MTLEWTYHKIHSEQNARLSMPGYVRDALIEFKHNFVKQQFSASPFRDPIYGRKVQYADVIDIPTFTKKQIHLLQRICGKFLYYARAIDSTMMHALNDLASQVTTGTMKTEEAQQCFLNYCATNPDASIVYYASDMIIRGDTDAAYLVASKARSRNAAYIFMGNKDRNNQIINGPIMVIAKILKMVVASAAEAEVASLFHAAQEIVLLRVTAEELGHKQPATPLRTDNETASDITVHYVRDLAEISQYHSAILITKQKKVAVEKKKECVSYNTIHGITLVCVVMIMELLVLIRMIGSHHWQKK